MIYNNAKILTYKNLNLKKLGPIKKITLWLFILSFAFDYRGPIGGTWPQYVFLSLNILSAVLFMLPSSSEVSSFHSNKEKIINILLWIMIIAALFTSIYNDVPLKRSLRVAYPFFLCSISMLFIINLNHRNIDPLEILKPLLFSSMLAFFWAPCYAILIKGIPLSIMRYQVISPALIIVLSWSIADILITNRVKGVHIIFISSSVILIILSVTRIYLVNLIVLLSLYIYYNKRINGRYTKVLFNKNSIKYIVIILISLVIAIQLRPNILSSWIGRLYRGPAKIGFDASIVDRIAEYSGLLESISKNNINKIFGVGYGAEYYISNINMLNNIIKSREIGLVVEKYEWGTSHNLILYSFFSGGILTGWILPFVMIFTIYYSFKNIQYSLKKGNNLFIRSAIFINLSLLSFFIQGITAHPFGDRLTGIIIGILLGLSFMVQTKIKEYT